MKNLYNFSKNHKIFTNKYFINTYHPDGIEHSYIVFLNNQQITKNKIIWYEKNEKHFHLGYIGFQESFQRKGILKNYIHPHCIDFMKKKGVEIITLKPLVTTFVVWVLLGFKVEKELEEIHIKQIIKEFLLENDIITTEDFGKMHLKEIVKKYKDILKSKNFPSKLEKIYYTNFKKVLK